MTVAPSLLVTCHPSPHSLCASIAATIVAALQARNAPVLVDDLAARHFNPVVGASELARYFDPEQPADIAALADNLRRARELIFVYPVWMYTLPAQLKGWFDRLWRPGIAFELVGGDIVPLLTGIERLTAIATHGRGKEETERIGDGTRMYFETSIPSVLPGLKAVERFDFYALDTADRNQIAHQLDAVRRHFAADW